MPNLGAINHGNQKKMFEFLSLNQKGKVDIKEKRKRRETVPPKTKLRRGKVDGIQKSLERKMQSNNGKREKKSKERKEKLSGLKS